MAGVSLGLVLSEVFSMCPDATVREESDGNIVIVTNMKLNNGILLPFDDEFDITVDY